MIALLTEIHGIGPKLAAKLARTLPKKKYTWASIRTALKRVDSLPIAAQIDLEYNPQHAPWEIINQIHAIMQSIRGIKLEICGSYRRGKSSCKDIDLVISKGRYRDVWGRFVAAMEGTTVTIMPPYAVGNEKINCLVQYLDYTIRMDVFLVQPAEWAFTILYATGSKQFNIMMRAKAKAKGMLLNRTGLHKDDIQLYANTERQIFALVGMPYVQPRHRNL